MYRSASSSRFSGDHYSYYSSPTSKISTALRAFASEANDLPVYEPLSEPAKKEKARARFAENAVHVIPFVLFLCAFILWFASNPDVDVPTRGNSLAQTLEGLPLDDGHVDSDGTGHLPMEVGDIVSAMQGDTRSFLSDNRSS